MKKLIILKHGGGELANQLWNYVSIYAYGLGIKAEIKNPSFFEYHPYFNFIDTEGSLTKIFSYWFKDSLSRRSSPRNKFFRNLYAIYVKIILLFHKSSSVSSLNTKNERVYLENRTSKLPSKNVIYFIGWLFRNPDGLLQYRNELLKKFAPNKKISSRTEEIITPLKDIYKHIVGVHLRQGDYKTFKGGMYLLHQTRVFEILNEYITKNSLTPSQVVFILTSDGIIEENTFKGLNIYVSRENAVTDLFLLSKTETIIGSDSSFGAFASWYGDIPHIIGTKEPVNWAYYADKKSFFENKYCTLAKY